MANAGFIFGGNTPWSYEELQRKRAIAEQLAQANMHTPQNVGEGLAAIGRALGYRGISRRADAREAELRGQWDQQFGSLFGGAGGGSAGDGGAPAGNYTPPPLPSAPDAWNAAVSASPVQPEMRTDMPISVTPLTETGEPAPVADSLVSALMGQNEYDRSTNMSAQAPSAAGGSVHARLMADLQRDFGFSREQAAGVVGNLAHETGNFQHMQEIAPVVPGSRGGYGFAQWTGPRRRAFEAWAAQNGLDPTSYEANYGFLRHEMTNTPESAVVDRVRGQDDVAGATQAFSEQFLRPGVVNMGSREGYAQQAGQLAGLGPMPQGQAAPQVAPQVAPQPAPQAAPDMQQIMAALNNPMATPEQKQVLMAMLERQMNPPAAPDRERVADSRGILRYVDTGEQVFADDAAPPEANYRQVTGEQLGLTGDDATAIYNVAPDGQVTRIGGGGLTVNTGPNETEFSRQAAGVQVEQLSAIANQGQNQTRNMILLDELESTLAAGGSGAITTLQSLAGAIGVPTAGLSEIQAAEAIISQLVPQQRPPGSGTMSDADLALYKKSLPSLMNQPGGNARIIETMQAIADYDRQIGAIAQQALNSEITPAEANRQIMAVENPLAYLRRNGGSVAAELDAIDARLRGL